VIRTTIRINQKCFVLRILTSLQGEVGAKRRVGVLPRLQRDPSRPAAPATSPYRGGKRRQARQQVHPGRHTEASDGGKASSRQRAVIRARLSDAKYFYDTDLKVKLEDRLPKFKQIVFHESLARSGNALNALSDCRRDCNGAVEPADFFHGKQLSPDDSRRAGLLPQESSPRCSAVQGDLLTEVSANSRTARLMGNTTRSRKARTRASRGM